MQHSPSDGTAELIVGWSSEAAPVFVDATGKRGRRLRIAASLAGACVVAYTIVLGLAVVGRQVEPLSFVSVPASGQAGVNVAEPSLLTAAVEAAPRPERGGQTQPVAHHSKNVQNQPAAASPGTD